MREKNSKTAHAWPCYCWEKLMSFRPPSLPPARLPPEFANGSLDPPPLHACVMCVHCSLQANLKKPVVNFYLLSCWDFHFILSSSLQANLKKPVVNFYLLSCMLRFSWMTHRWSFFNYVHCTANRAIQLHCIVFVIQVSLSSWSCLLHFAANNMNVYQYWSFVIDRNRKLSIS